LTDQSKLSLRSLTIHRYEQFRDCPRIEFSPDDNLILGINGSGKTSLLRLLAAVLRWNYDALLGKAFDIEFEQVLDEGLATEASISGRVKCEPPVPGAGQQFQGWRSVRSKYEGFEAWFDIAHSGSPLCTVEIRDSTIHPRMEGTKAFGDVTPVESWIALGISKNLDSQLEQDEPAAAIRAFTGRNFSHHADDTFVVRETDIDFVRLTEHLLYKYSVSGHPSLIFEPEDFSEIETRQWFGLVYELAARAAEQQNGHDYLVPVIYKREADASDRLDMRSLLDALAAESISFRLKIEKTESVSEGRRFEGNGVEIGVRFASGTEEIDSRLTFGQKRLVTIALGALLCGGSPLLVDEIDNGLHPGLLETVMGLIRGRQTFIASHNKLVVDLLDYESHEDIRRTIHICRRNPDDGTQSLVALSEDQVREMFEKIEVGILNPSDVLLQEGLW
jgi:energy-coupling factor transporter ATP-binding protein EcfA2